MSRQSLFTERDRQTPQSYYGENAPIRPAQADGILYGYVGGRRVELGKDLPQRLQGKKIRKKRTGSRRG